jgi:enoyl-CoA hydratase/carnithine racemase
MPVAFPHLQIEYRGAVGLVRLDRAEKRNAVNDALLGSLRVFFSTPPEGVRVVVLTGAGEHFCSGIDLSEHRHRKPFEVMLHSQSWHRAFHEIEYGRIPVVSVLNGGVIGGGLELAAATHVRVASSSAFYALPEGQRGIFVGGGATVRVRKLIGTSRMVEMMLTGRVYDAKDGQTLGLSHYLVEDGKELETALGLAERIASNSDASNYAILHTIGRVADMSSSDGLFTESIMAALVQTSPEVHDRLAEFLDRKSGRVSVQSGQNTER